MIEINNIIEHDCLKHLEKLETHKEIIEGLSTSDSIHKCMVCKSFWLNSIQEDDLGTYIKYWKQLNSK